MDVLNFCRSLGISNTSVIGYSDGGNLALWLAVNAPEMFRKVVAIFPDTRTSGSTKLALWATQAALGIMKGLVQLGFQIQKQIMRFELMLTDTGITAKDLQNIKTSVLILYAENDLVTEDHLLEISGLIPGYQVRKITNANHITIPFRAETIKTIQDYLLA